MKETIDALPPEVRPIAKEALRLYLYRSSVEAWSRRSLGLNLDPWQVKLVSTPPGGRTIALTHRQAGKSVGGAVAASHLMMFGGYPSLSLVLAPTQKQSAEFVLKVRGFLAKAGAKLTADNAFSLALDNGSRILAMPGADDAGLRGLSVDGILIVDEAARVQDIIVDAARPMLLRHKKTARFFMLSTAWAKSGVFWRTWDAGVGWTKIEAKIDECTHLTSEDIESERRDMSTAVFNREYLNVFDSLESRFFDQGSIASAFGESGVLEAGVISEGNDPIIGAQRAFGNPFKEMRFGRV